MPADGGFAAVVAAQLQLVSERLIAEHGRILDEALQRHEPAELVQLRAESAELRAESAKLQKELFSLTSELRGDIKALAEQVKENTALKFPTDRISEEVAARVREDTAKELALAVREAEHMRKASERIESERRRAEEVEKENGAAAASRRRAEEEAAAKEAEERRKAEELERQLAAEAERKERAEAELRAEAERRAEEERQRAAQEEEEKWAALDRQEAEERKKAEEEERARQEDEERKKAEEAAKREAERKEAERKEAERKAAEELARQEAERKEAEARARAEAERREAEGKAEKAVPWMTSQSGESRSALEYALELEKKMTPGMHDQPHEDGRFWIVVGGAETGGILVRQAKSVQSPGYQTRLTPGTKVQEIEVTGKRLHYRRIRGDGPDFGWVSIEGAGGKRLMEPHPEQ